MKKNKNKVNSLIKKKNLALLLKKGNIKNIEKVSIDILEKNIYNHIISLIPLLKKQMLINGRKTLKKQDVVKVLENIDSNKKYDYANLEI